MPIDYKIIAERMEADAFQRDCLISVLVEDYADERFWELIIESIFPALKDKIDFPNPCPTGTRGTSTLKKYTDFVNSNLIICLDSDCEYLFDSDVWYNRAFIFNTITYSKESFQFHPISLNEICKDLGIGTYNFQELFNNISKVVAEVFYFWLYFKEIQDKNKVNNSTFQTILNLDGVDFEQIGNEHNIISTIQDRVSELLNDLKAEMGESWFEATLKHDIPNIKKRLDQLSIKEEELLLYCNGHAIMDHFVKPFMEILIELLKEKKILEISEQLANASGNNLQNTINRIRNFSQQDIDTKLLDSFKGLIYNTAHCKELQAIKDALSKQLNKKN